MNKKNTNFVDINNQQPESLDEGSKAEKGQFRYQIWNNLVGINCNFQIMNFSFIQFMNSYRLQQYTGIDTKEFLEVTEQINKSIVELDKNISGLINSYFEKYKKEREKNVEKTKQGDKSNSKD